jgi:hypothetical protein
MGNAVSVPSSKVGNIKATACNKYGEELFPTTLKDVTVVSEGFNLFSVTKLQLQGWELRGNQDMIWLEKDGKKIVFDIKILSPKGMLYTMCLKREVGATASDQAVKMSFKLAHGKLGHIGNDATRDVAKKLGWEITDKGSICESCAVSKAKQKSLKQNEGSKPL